MATMKDLYFYPVKGLRGLRTNELAIDAQGPRLDRQWMIVDEQNRFLSQRTHPFFAQIGLRLVDGFEIELSQPELGLCEFGLEEREGDAFDVVIWKHTVPAFEVSHEVSAWMSEVAGQKVKVVRMSEQARRPFSADFPDRTVRFVDFKPLLVLSTASLKGLSDRVGQAVSAARFRPNIVVEGTLPHAEDQWSAFRAGSVEFKATAPCRRCKVTTVHPLTGVMTDEPLKTLMDYRRTEKGVTFGHYYANVGMGVVRVGDQLTLG